MYTIRNLGQWIFWSFLSKKITLVCSWNASVNVLINRAYFSHYVILFLNFHIEFTDDNFFNASACHLSEVPYSWDLLICCPFSIRPQCLPNPWCIENDLHLNLLSQKVTLPNNTWRPMQWLTTSHLGSGTDSWAVTVREREQKAMRSQDSTRLALFLRHAWPVRVVINLGTPMKMVEALLHIVSDNGWWWNDPVWIGPSFNKNPFL